MKTTLWAAAAALALALAPLANAAEGGRDPFPFRSAPIATTTFPGGNAAATVQGSATAAPQPSGAATAAPTRGQAPRQATGTQGRSGTTPR